jgi:tetratricopeptide (TPR) repeat protein
MAEKPICSNCGNVLKDSWLVCKFCHQARWKRITPYYVWGAVFLVFAGWSITQKVFPPPDPENFISLFLPGVAVIFGIIGVVMLMMAVIATLRGLTVRKMPPAPRGGSTPDWRTPAPVPPVVAGSSTPSMPAVKPSIPGADPIVQPAAPNLGPRVQTIHCQKCKQQNAPSANKCKKCGTDLLPGAGIGARLGGFIFATILALVCFGVALLIYAMKAELEGKDLIYLVGLVLFGILVFLVGIYYAFRKVPLYERYATRAKRHVSLNPWQAIVDYGAAIDLAPQTQAFDSLLERGKLYKKMGMINEARSDLQHALQNITARMANSKAPAMELKKQRAEIYQNLEMQDEYAMEMLQYTIDKEKTFKTKRGEIAMGAAEGIRKGTEDVKRDELEKMRAEILKNNRYAIVGHCKKCRATVNLDAKLECNNNPKHRNITTISPTIRNP